jgi:hypothetical protein
MAGWLDRFRTALTGSSGDGTAVRTALLIAQRSRARLELEPVHTAGDEPKLLATTIEQVADDAVIVSQPVLGGSVRPLARFEELIMRFTDSRGVVSGRTEALGRTRFRSGAGGTLYGYRLAIPKSLHVEERRREPRLPLDERDGNAVELIVPAEGRTLVGEAKDISAHGAHLLFRRPELVPRPGQEATMKMEPNLPTGPVEEQVTIVDTDASLGGGLLAVHVRFHGENRAIGHVIRSRRAVPEDRRSA